MRESAQPEASGGRPGGSGRQLCEGLLSVGRVLDARRVAGDMLRVSAKLGARASLARAHCLLGEIERQGDGGDLDQAGASFRQALALSRQLGMRPLSADCHLGLGRLHRQLGRAQDARQELAAACAQYREIEMQFYLGQAERELGEMAE